VRNGIKKDGLEEFDFIMLGWNRHILEHGLQKSFLSEEKRKKVVWCIGVYVSPFLPRRKKKGARGEMDELARGEGSAMDGNWQTFSGS
jgi:hypothetical protein